MASDTAALAHLLALYVAWKCPKVQEVHDVAQLQVDTSTTGTAWGTGGMATKLTAARIACASGCTMAICNSARPEAVRDIVAGGAARCTVFRPICGKMRDRKRWILSGARRQCCAHAAARCCLRCHELRVWGTPPDALTRGGGTIAPVLFGKPLLFSTLRFDHAQLQT